ncbi:hypothetical protein SAMN05216428_11271 [Nitrosospira sp. Nsp11]|uniref:hypothetical protein n=1 Tax=Nitrosospira sp. Nsp11 TaxID=1855338 RepID=UPI000918E4FE|nr:hypothetical protein [Nitrosospira sp. Nsp11]SHM04880.1 hypothetical protein SAMN05216428_11271 [Nitrosospira sp. Nsp11]
MAHNITDLRGHLFDTLESLKDKEKPMDIDRAKAIADVSQVIINSVKVEVDYSRVTGNTVASGFLGEPDTKGGLPQPNPITDHQLPEGTISPKPGVLVHKMRG